MWFSPKTLVAVDTRSAAVAVFSNSFSGPRLERFASGRFTCHAGQESLFSDVLSDSRDTLDRLARELKAPLGDVTLLLPLGAVFPAVFDSASLKRGGVAEVGEDEMVRFRLAPLLPFSVALADVQAERCDQGRGGVLAQAVLKTLVTDGRALMTSLGFRRVRVTSALSAVLRGLKPAPRALDLIYGDSACAIAVRGERGFVESVHLRLLLEGEDREQRALDEAFRAATLVGDIRVSGASIDGLRRKAHDLSVVSAFPPMDRALGDPQTFPFLAVFPPRAQS